LTQKLFQRKMIFSPGRA